jgi:hypothetical protein
VSAVPWWACLLAAALPITVIGAATVLTCVSGTKTRRAQAQPVSDERDYGAAFAPLDHDDATSYDPRWDEHRPGAGPQRGEKEAL